MKPIKSPRSAKPSQVRLPARKVSSSSRKMVSSSSSSSSRMLSAPRHGGVRGLSPGSKHMSRSKKHSHSPRPQSYNSPPPMHRSRGSPVSDRIHSSKRPVEYEKRRIESHSPVSRMASRNVTDRRVYPPVGSHAKMRSESPGSHYPNPPKKKIRREVAHMSPPRGFEKPHMISNPHISHKPSSSAPSMYHDRDRTFASVASRPPSYPLPERSRASYDMPPPPPHKKGMPMDPPYPPSIPKRGSQYLSERGKRYGLTLDERFRSVSGDMTHHDSQRVQFTREDLENITIDIKRNLRDFSPTVRRIIDPTEVKLVRRPHEGHRPIFDRQEIKQAPRDLREDAYNEHKLYAQSGERRKAGPFGLNYKEMENYEITRYKFDGNHTAPAHSDNTHRLSDKWSKIGQKSASSALDRDERKHGYPSRPSPVPFEERRRMPRPRSVDRDFRPEHRPKPEYPPPVHKPLPVSPDDLRHSLAIRRKDGSIHDARERLLERRLSDRDHLPGMHSSSHHYTDVPKYPPSSHKLKEKGVSGNRRIDDSRESSLSYSRSGEKMRLKPEKPSEYPPPPERFKYSSWDEKPSDVPKPFDYYEDDRDREGNDSFYSRGGGFRGGFKGRGSFRGRSFRGGSSRGSGFRGRGSFRGSTSPRGKGYPPKRKSSGSY